MACSLQFTDHGIEGVVPLDLLPPDVRAKYQAKPNERSKRAKKEELKSATAQAEENQVLTKDIPTIKNFSLIPEICRTKENLIFIPPSKILVPCNKNRFVINVYSDINLD